MSVSRSCLAFLLFFLLLSLSLTGIIQGNVVPLRQLDFRAYTSCRLSSSCIIAVVHLSASSLLQPSVEHSSSNVFGINLNILCVFAMFSKWRNTDKIRWKNFLKYTAIYVVIGKYRTEVLTVLKDSWTVSCHEMKWNVFFLLCRLFIHFPEINNQFIDISSTLVFFFSFDRRTINVMNRHFILKHKIMFSLF